jgi:myo-inositol 2-dehydrogenase/D-chiro-inositol 1-dehydrogenase
MTPTPQNDRDASPAATRRDVIKAGAGIGALALASGVSGALGRSAPARLKVGLVGCGGRGTGAVVQALRADEGTVLWAMGDVFPDRIDACLGHATNAMDGASGKIDLAEERKFVGFDADRRVIDSGVDVVLLCTPPGFRPEQLRYAVESGTHVFCEKPVAVDSPGVRSVLESARVAREKGLALMSGFCWRYHDQMREAFGHLHDGGIGDVRVVQCTYNTTGFPVPKPRQDGWSDAEFQVRNWHYFTPISGDHIVEQAVHAIDWIGWAFGGTMPTRCVAVGGRSTRPDLPETGNIWDNFGVTFEFENGGRAYHQCRHWPNTPADNTAYIVGTEGDCRVMPWRGRHLVNRHDGGSWKGSAVKNDMYQREHDLLFAAIRSGEALNDGELMAHSTLMGIMARQAAYTGQAITWEQILSSTEDLNPEPWAWSERATPSIPVPGVTRFV